jgi:hypothetical protein
MRKKIKDEEHRTERKLNTKWLQFNLEENSMTCTFVWIIIWVKRCKLITLKARITSQEGVPTEKFLL